MDFDTLSPLDVWLRFESPEDEEASAEANTFYNQDGSFRVEWYLTAVGQIGYVGPFETHEDARFWLHGHGFADFTS